MNVWIQFENSHFWDMHWEILCFSALSVFLLPLTFPCDFLCESVLSKLRLWVNSLGNIYLTFSKLTPDMTFFWKFFFVILEIRPVFNPKLLTWQFLCHWNQKLFSFSVQLIFIWSHVGWWWYFVVSIKVESKF